VTCALTTGRTEVTSNKTLVLLTTSKCKLISDCQIVSMKHIKTPTIA